VVHPVAKIPDSGRAPTAIRAVRRSRQLALLLGVLAATALAVSACGGGHSPSSTSSSTSTHGKPAAKKPGY
jgi:hypothetical protein